MPNRNSSSGTRRRKDRSEATLARLLDAAQAVFAERGYHAANIHEICARADVGIGTFYAHFDHKRELLKQVMVERAVLLSRMVAVEDLLDRRRLIEHLRQAVDDPVGTGLWRAWHDAILEHADIAAFHGEWRSGSLKELSATIDAARKRRPVKAGRLDAAIVAWTTITLARDLAIIQRLGAPGVEGFTDLVLELVFGTLAVAPTRSA
jgi:AcrR family transcriptional regulator